MDMLPFHYHVISFSLTLLDAIVMDEENIVIHLLCLTSASVEQKHSARERGMIYCKRIYYMYYEKRSVIFNICKTYKSTSTLERHMNNNALVDSLKWY